MHDVNLAFGWLVAGTAGGADQELDEWIHLGESMIAKCMRKFVFVIICIFREEYLQAPTTAKKDVACSPNFNARHGFSGCLGSIDCWDE